MHNLKEDASCLTSHFGILTIIPNKSCAAFPLGKGSILEHCSTYRWSRVVATTHHNQSQKWMAMTQVHKLHASKFWERYPFGINRDIQKLEWHLHQSILPHSSDLSTPMTNSFWGRWYINRKSSLAKTLIFKAELWSSQKGFVVHELTYLLFLL